MPKNNGQGLVREDHVACHDDIQEVVTVTYSEVIRWELRGVLPASCCNA